jgi:hypothetical protein
MISAITTIVVINAPMPTMKITGFFTKKFGLSLIKEFFIACAPISLVKNRLFLSSSEVSMDQKLKRNT